MTDVHSKKVRSHNMAMIKSKNTKPEIIVRKYIFNQGFRFRVNVKSLPGKPDVVLSKYRTVIFINGCFWHGHDECPYFVIPKTRTQWWLEKIQKTKKRDEEQRNELRKGGWNIMTIWECQLRPNIREETLSGIVLLLQKTYLNIHKKKYMTSDTSSFLVAEPKQSYKTTNTAFPGQMP